MVEISKKKFKKTKRPSSASLIDAADEEVVESAGEKQMEIELVLLDAEVVNEGGIVCVGVVSLGTVAIDGTQVVVSEQGFVTSLGLSISIIFVILADVLTRRQSWTTLFVPTVVHRSIRLPIDVPRAVRRLDGDD